MRTIVGTYWSAGTAGRVFSGWERKRREMGGRRTEPMRESGRKEGWDEIVEKGMDGWDRKPNVSHRLQLLRLLSFSMTRLIRAKHDGEE